MPRTIRFHLDENCPAAIAEALRRRGIDITTTPGAGLLTASDEEQTAYAFAKGRVIFTRYSAHRHRLLPSGQTRSRQHHPRLDRDLGGHGAGRDGAFLDRLRRRDYHGALILEQWPRPPQLLIEAATRLRELLSLSSPGRVDGGPRIQWRRFVDARV